MTGTVLAVASGKGGVGKTTTAINLGAMLAAAEYSVVVVDTDLGMANVGGYLDFEIDGATLHEVLSGDASVEDAIYNAPGGIDVVPSSTDIYTFAQSQTAQLQEVVADLREEYEYVLLDTGAGISYDTILPLSLADDVLLVTTPDVAAVRDTAKTAELTARVDGSVRGAVLTQRGNDILNADNVEGTLDTEVLTVVPEDETVPMGIDAGRPLAVFSPNSLSAKAYRELANILTGATETPKLSGEPAPSDSTESSPPSDSTASSPPLDSASPSPSLADAEFELSTSSPEASPVTEPDSATENADESVASEESDPEPTSPDGRPLDPEPTTDMSASAELGMIGSDEHAESADAPSETSDAPSDPATSKPPADDVTTDSESVSESNDDPVHDLIDRRVIKTDNESGSEPTVESIPLEDETDSETGADDSDIPTDDVDVPEATTDTATPSEETVEDDADEFGTVLSDNGEQHEESSTDENTQSDLPDEIVEAEPKDGNDADDVEAVPFQDEPVRPDLNDNSNDDDDSDDENNGLFGRIGSLFR